VLDGFDRLMQALRENGADGEALASETVGLLLGEAKRHGMPWRLAWNTAVNNVAAPALGGYIDPELQQAVADDRELLAEVKPAFRAAYEGAPPPERDLVVAARRADSRLGDLAIGPRIDGPQLDPPMPLDHAA
jgi:hypothetical protein